ncbi:MAG: glycine cleavage T C-terminal barrel domain-containing protein [Acidimicrobiales bacterium]
MLGTNTGSDCTSQPTGRCSSKNKANATTTLGVWGPNAVATVAKLTESDLSQEAFPYGSIRNILIDGIPCMAFRISYVGEAGFELYTSVQHGTALWDAVAGAGAEFGIVPVGIGVYGSTGRVEKGYRLMGAELESEYTPVEAGLARPKVKANAFIGKEAYLQAREAEPVAMLCSLVVDDHHDSNGVKRYMTGGNEPILTLDGERIVDAKGRVSRVTTASGSPSTGNYILMAYLPPELAVVGTKLQVMYMNDLHPVSVVAAGANLAVFDPDDSRMKG